MFGTILTSLFKSKYTWIVLGIAIVAGMFYYLYAENRRLEAERQVLLQNNAFALDSVAKMKDSLQTLSVGIANLQSQSDEWKGKYIAISTKYQIALDTIRVLRSTAGHVEVIGDTVAIVEFDTTQGIAHVQGRTEANVVTKTGTYSLNIGFSDIETQSFLFYDEADKLWKIRTLSLSPGIKLRGLSTIDDETFRKIQGVGQEKDKVPSTFGFGGFATYDRVYGGIVFMPSQWMFSIHYKVFDKFLEQEAWNDRIMIGIHYFIF